MDASAGLGLWVFKTVFSENGGFWGGGFGAAARRGEIAFRSGRCSVGGREEGEKEGERHKED